MKKVRISLKSVPGAFRTFTLFPSVEDVYFWLTELDCADTSKVPDVDRIELKEQKEFLEVEWLGCEYAHEPERSLRFDHVRLVKARPSQNSSGHLISLHHGWTVSDVMPFQGSHGDIEVKRLVNDDPQFNLSKIFQDDAT